MNKVVQQLLDATGKPITDKWKILGRRKDKQLEWWQSDVWYFGILVPAVAIAVFGITTFLYNLYIVLSYRF